MLIIQQNEATAAERRIYFRLVATADGYSPVTGGAAGVSVTVSKNGAAPAAGAGTVAEVAGGLYYYEAAAAEVDTLGSLILTPAHASAVTASYEALVVEYDPTAAPSTDTEVATAVRTELATELGRLDAAVSTRSTLTAAGVRTELATELARIDVAISSRLAAAGYTAPDNAAISALAGYVDTEVSAILSLLQDPTVGLAAIETLIDELETRLTAARAAKLDSLTFTVAGQVDANVQAINDAALAGDGAATPWGPA